jgi:hypothetical protein
VGEPGAAGPAARLQQRSHPIDGLYLGGGAYTQGSRAAWVAATTRPGPCARISASSGGGPTRRAASTPARSASSRRSASREVHVETYVLVQTEVGAAADASDEIGALEGVLSAEAITGP